MQERGCNEILNSFVTSGREADFTKVLQMRNKCGFCHGIPHMNIRDLHHIREILEKASTQNLSIGAYILEYISQQDMVLFANDRMTSIDRM